MAPHDTSSASGQPAPEAQHGRLYRWFDERTGLTNLLSGALDEPIPGGARYAYIFGSGLLFIFLTQVITGVLLALYYVPSVDHAHVSVDYITKVVAAGDFLRSLHVYGASAMVIILLVHLTQTFMYGSYKGKRELLWVSGTILFVLVMAMAFTGYLLPWDQKAYFATAVGTNVATEVPVVGAFVKQLLRGGDQIGTLTISRFYAMHVLYIPALIFLFIGAHLVLFRHAGPAGPPDEDPVHPKMKPEMFYPRQVVMDMGFAFFLIAALAVAAFIAPATLGPTANPADTNFLPRPEWYYRPLFEWLKIFPGELDFLRVVIIPGIIVALFIGLPFLDRRLERRPWRRPFAVGTFSVVFIVLISLGAYSYYQDDHNPVIAAQLTRQAVAESHFMARPFEPQMTGHVQPPAAPTGGGATAALVAQGRKIFQNEGCSECHGPEAVGGLAPSLIGIGKKFTLAQMEHLFQNPLPAMDQGGMPHFTFSSDQVKALRTYFDSMH